MIICAGFGFSGRINFVNGSPEDVANVLNTIYNLLQRLQYEQCLKDDTQMENRRLRTEAQSYDNNLGRLRKELEIKERDLATSRIRVRALNGAEEIYKCDVIGASRGGSAC